MNRTNQLTKIHLSGKPYIIYESQNGFDLYTDFSKKIILNNKIIGITRTIPSFNSNDKIIIGEENGIHGGIKNIFYKKSFF